MNVERGMHASSTPLLFPCGQRPKGWEDKPNGAKAHSSGKLKFPSAQTDAHPASASQAVLILHPAVSRSLAAQTVLWQQKLNHFLVVTFIIHTFADKS